MNTAFWIFLGTVIVSVVFYIISLFKKWKLVEKITHALFLPLFGGLVISLLFTKLPDSIHIVQLTFTAFLFAEIAELFIIFSDTKKHQTIENICFLCSTIAWIQLYFSTYYIYAIHLWAIIVMTLITMIACGIYLAFAGHQQRFIMITNACCFLAIGFLTYTTFVNLIYSHKFYPLLLLLGCILLFTTLISQTLLRTEKSKFSDEGGKIMHVVFINAAQLLTAFSGILIQFTL